MKTKITLFLLAFIPALCSVGQSIQDGTRFFHIAVGFSGNLAFIDTLTVTETSGDSIQFSISKGLGQNKKSFIKRGAQIYKPQGIDTVLLYDYSLEAGDTFVYSPIGPDELKFQVDSIKSILLEDGLTYKHWYLHILEENHKHNLIWVENCGEKVMGWDYTLLNVSHTPALQAVCHNEQMIFKNEWFDHGNSCDFDSLKRLVSVQKNTIKRIQGYPNPASNQIQWNLQGNLPYQIYDVQGKLVLSGLADSKLMLDHLSHGLYRLFLMNGQQMVQIEFIKE